MMKIKIFMLALTMAIFSFAPASVQAADAALKIGFVDMHKVQKSSVVAKALGAELDAKRKDFQEQVVKEENALRSTEQELIKQKSTLGEADLKKRVDALGKKVADFQKSVQSRRQAMEIALNKAMGEFHNEVVKAVNGIAKEKGLSAVFTTESVIMGVNEMDYTKETIKRLDNQVKKIKIKWPSIKG